MSERNYHNPEHETSNPEPDRARRKAAILTSLTRGSTRARACEAAGVPRRTFYNWLDQHSDFRDQVEDAEQRPIAACEAVALRCALKAEDDPRYLRALFHFLRHRAGWGESRRKESEPARLTLSSFDQPDPDAELIPSHLEAMADEDPFLWGIAKRLPAIPTGFAPSPSPETLSHHEPSPGPEPASESIPDNAPGCPLGDGKEIASLEPAPDLDAYRARTHVGPDQPGHTGDGVPSVPCASPPSAPPHSHPGASLQDTPRTPAHSVPSVPPNPAGISPHNTPHPPPHTTPDRSPTPPARYIPSVPLLPATPTNK